jgi:hypothetical protein
MLAVVVAAGLLALPAVGWIFAFPCLALLVARWLWLRRYRRGTAFGFGGLAILGSVLYVVAGTYPDYMLLPALFIGWWVVILPTIGGLGVAWADLATRDDAIPRRSWLVPCVSVVALAFMPLVTLVSLWPVRLAFLVVKPRMERLADRAAAGQVFGPPQWVGSFRLVGSEVDPALRIVGLIIDPNPNGRTGFVRIHPKTPAGRRLAALLGTDMNVDLGWGWSYLQDD